MYEELPDDPSGLLAFFVLVFSAGLPLLLYGLKAQRRNLSWVGVGMLITLVVGLILVAEPMKQVHTNRSVVMENNILTQYKTEYHSELLKDVQMIGPAGRYDRGKYFLLTYEDQTTEKQKFYFSESGIPSCDCTLKH